MALKIYFARVYIYIYKNIHKLQHKTASMQFYKLHTSNSHKLTLPAHILWNVWLLVINNYNI